MRAKTKSDIRTYVAKKFKTISLQKRWERSAALHNQLFDDPIWDRAQSIAVTVATKREIPTQPIIERAWQEGKRVVVPKTKHQERLLLFYELRSFSELKPGPFQLDEPDPRICPTFPKHEIDLVVVPGLAFNEEGYRIGFGGGYYDRFLSQVKVPTVAFAFSFQLFATLPIEKHDIPVQHLFKEEHP